MPTWKREKVNRDSSSQSSFDKNKDYGASMAVRAVERVCHMPGHALTSEGHLHRGLKSRHITMIAIGGAIGNGLIIATAVLKSLVARPLARAGPAPVLISYAFIGFLVYIVMCALGEMAAWLPLPSGFTGYATRFCDPALGFALGYMYWFKYIMVNPGVFIVIFLVVIVCINYFGISFFGEFEFWLSSVKVVIIVGLVLLSFILALGGVPDHDRKGFRSWKNPGAFNTYIEGLSLQVNFLQG
ncbi:uncharacterized protein FOMMEDRAFT_156205 [Fomitiporia mediterranea MF3/22]|uniref:uncharacterized protein n=1 Tax=Fomitiporia mediterranea (strain MF3/22) TaxID=694068 RepID=UPI0004407BF1|nr:uncharacterized protein FOMMEDRAFT_156205 [Fomitiporia mediterranea MF3/22]EJD02848.1 hypothetical protein FOMMEDRAFT_156205 [Fomitiporia mediterranea MF3/22]